MRDRAAHLDAFSQTTQRATRRRTVHVELLADTGVNGWDHQRMTVVVGESEMAYGRGINDGPDEFRIMTAAICFTAQSGAI
ncbi:unannotated protein [freshwater metagenome]|uniref:Unannotated protein n=1 Tax=freshwater metagenome TaxID=449393 RepID=A0A6J7KGL2_9ZZZZ